MISIIIGFIIGFINKSNGTLKQIIETKGFFINFYEIFIHNLWVAILIILLSFLIYIGGTFVVFSNFIIFGESLYMAMNLSYKKTISIYLHGIFEIPAIIIALFISYSISTFLIKKLKDEDFSVLNNFKKLKKHFIIMIILFIIGATIESFTLNIML
ncbi:stage II sporulation protein M [Bacillus sp. Xin]|uniref:BacC n=1 Tax=Bacillus sp. Xin1 TaxID=2740676 RepID=A0A7D5DQR1_9BACI|nr:MULTISPECIES: stage II sporulation protein M [unclassified Bacillus (in: firmicutes)]MBC6973921.1 stage II sporulation protein M [Bacillus sp. Xin]NSW39298.1 stage II sporulation protein M [Bacillus sp. Xin1]QLA09669.1 BacC [Bacillus sp. Xin1]